MDIEPYEIEVECKRILEEYFENWSDKKRKTKKEFLSELAEKLSYPIWDLFNH